MTERVIDGDCHSGLAGQTLSGRLADQAQALEFGSTEATTKKGEIDMYDNQGVIGIGFGSTVRRIDEMDEGVGTALVEWRLAV
jgi:hypothetical protein